MNASDQVQQILHASGLGQRVVQHMVFRSVVSGLYPLRGAGILGLGKLAVERGQDFIQPATVPGELAQELLRGTLRWSQQHQGRNVEGAAGCFDAQKARVLGAQSLHCRIQLLPR